MVKVRVFHHGVPQPSVVRYEGANVEFSLCKWNLQHVSLASGSFPRLDVGRGKFWETEICQVIYALCVGLEHDAQSSHIPSLLKWLQVIASRILGLPLDEFSSPDLHRVQVSQVGYQAR